MSETSLPRPTRKVAIADHLWNAFEQMAQEMATDRDGLINQAMFVFARLNGYIEAGAALAERAPTSARAMGTNPALAAPARAETPVTADSAPPPGSSRAMPPPPPPDALSIEMPESSATRRRAEPTVASPRGGGVDEFDALLESSAGRFSTPEQPRRATSIDEFAGADPRPGGIDAAVRAAAAAAPALATASAAAAEDAGLQPGLYVQLGAGERMHVDKDRFLIGRGKHCDLVIPSGKVSREHAVIVREGDVFFIEDLGSSNGTWLNKQRIQRCRIQDGQEYFVCSERLRCTVR